MLQQFGLVDVADEEFLGEWSYASPEEYYTGLMEIAAPIQNLMAKLSDTQQQEVKRLIIQAASQYRRGEQITFPNRLACVQRFGAESTPDEHGLTCPSSSAMIAKAALDTWSIV